MMIRVEGGLDFPLPRMVKVEQIFSVAREESIAAAVAREFRRPGVGEQIRPGMKIALGVGSRGLAGLVEIVSACVAEVKRRGAEPVILPAMGSHGEATAEGQTELLARYGISPETVGAPVDASMETTVIGETPDGIPVWFSTAALKADGIIPINRVKSHTSFRGTIESGLCKMLAVGLGKHRGATTLHRQGFERFDRLIPAATQVVLAKTPVLFGLASIENAEEQVGRLEAVLAGQIMQREPELLMEARAAMARILLPEFDVLIVGEMGKDVSGVGMDPNVTGRYHVSHLSGEPRIQRLVVLDLTERTHGNAHGVGTADITTQRLREKIDPAPTYTNAITATALAGSKIPLTMPTDREAIALAIRTLIGVDSPASARVVWIKNTLELGEIHMSESLWEANKGRPDLRQSGPIQEMRFTADGTLIQG